ncbi:SDR family NAD(P)-dependent oxidoreductase [Thermodesulfobacteriota bacterium]
MNKPQFSLEGKTALITGASGGIGKAVCALMGAAGAQLFLNGTRQDKLQQLAGELGGKGISSSYKALDITQPGAPAELVESVVSEMGVIDILVNSAGINRPQKAEDVSEQNWDDVMELNLKALFLVCREAGREMIKRRSGRIINISSQTGTVALPLRAAYCASKGGVNQLTKVLALEWAPHNVTVNAVAPTFVKTEFTAEMFKDQNFKKYVLDSIPLGRMAESDEVAYAVLYLACDFAKIITGAILAVDGGWTIK